MKFEITLKCRLSLPFKYGWNIFVHKMGDKRQEFILPIFLTFPWGHLDVCLLHTACHQREKHGRELYKILRWFPTKFRQGLLELRSNIVAFFYDKNILEIVIWGLANR